MGSIEDIMEISNHEFNDGFCKGLDKFSEEFLSQDDMYLRDIFLSHFRTIFPKQANLLWRVSVADVLSIARACFTKKIVVDGRSYYFFPRYAPGKELRQKIVVSLELKENIHDSVSDVCRQLDIGQFVSVFSVSQILYLRNNFLPIPLCSADVPLATGVEFATSIFDSAGVLVKLLKRGGGELADREFFTVEHLLSTARRVIKYNKVYVAGSNMLAPSPWQGGSDSIEMLKKTALRQYILKGNK